MFRHARKCGVKAYDGVRVKELEFSQETESACASSTDWESRGRPVSACYNRISDGTSGIINFEYLIDATGRLGLLNTKYLKIRRYNKGLNNIANWGYWQGAAAYAEGTARANSPYFEALRGELFFMTVRE